MLQEGASPIAANKKRQLTSSPAQQNAAHLVENITLLCNGSRQG
jgi:F0F1-type ATP synthase gamma subunit